MILNITIWDILNYWGVKPDFNDVTFKIMPDGASRVAALLAGDVDILEGLSPSSVPAVESKDGFKVAKRASARTLWLYVDTQNDNWPFVTDNDGNAMSVNPFLWKGALETIYFMPLSSADQIGGTIITDWYSTSANPNERCKLNIFISGIQLNTENLKVASFCQEFIDPSWINKKVDQEDNIKIENAILNKAKKLKLQSS